MQCHRAMVGDTVFLSHPAINFYHPTAYGLLGNFIQKLDNASLACTHKAVDHTRLR